MLILWCPGTAVIETYCQVSICVQSVKLLIFIKATADLDLWTTFSNKQILGEMGGGSGGVKICVL